MKDEKEKELDGAEKKGAEQPAEQQELPQQPREEQKKKKERPKRFGTFFCGAVFGVLLSALLFVLSTGYISIPFVGSIILGKDPAAAVTETASPSEARSVDLNYGKINLKLRTIQTILNQDYYYTMDEQAMEDGIFTGLMYGLTEEDPYAAYYPASLFAEEINDNRGNYYGIGALMSQDRETNVMTVEQVYPDSPAEKAGLLKGDILKKVNREDVTYMDLSTVVDDYVKGEEGSYVNLTVEREGQEIELQIMRGKVTIPFVFPSMLSEEQTGGGKIGYIYISGFDEATVEQFEKAVEDLTRQGAGGIVIDLRDNLGGIMNSALYMLDYLLPDQDGTYSDHEIDGKDRGRTLVLYTEDKEGRNFAYYAQDGHETELPLAVLINQNSASSSEIFAGVLKDYHKALLVGTTTYGKGIVQTEVPLADGSAVKYTSAQYFTPSGYAVHGKGVEPDLTVEAEEAFLEAGADAENPDPSIDNQLREALQALGSQAASGEQE